MDWSFFSLAKCKMQNANSKMQIQKWKVQIEKWIFTLHIGKVSHINVLKFHTLKW